MAERSAVLQGRAGCPPPGGIVRTASRLFEPDGTPRLNPNGRVPTLVHDGVAIWESAAITIYLGETFGEAESVPRNLLFPSL